MRTVLVVAFLAALYAMVVVPYAEHAFGSQPVYFDKVRFVQYQDENTAFEEIKNNNLDIYYYRIPADRIEDPESRQNTKIFKSTGGSFSLLLNPAKVDGRFNPFSLEQVRFAMNYLVDRKLIVDELLGGFGMPMYSAYGPFDPDYLHVVDKINKFNFRHNPGLAENIITNELRKEGAFKVDGTWHYIPNSDQSETKDNNDDKGTEGSNKNKNSKPVRVTLFIRSDDPIRKSIGEILASELEEVGFVVEKNFGDLNKAFTQVYGSDPAELEWHVYTEGWGGRGGFVRYDSLVPAQMYSPWFSSMPGFNNPAYWNYENNLLDNVTRKLFNGGFDSRKQRANLIEKATVEGINESVRVFIASKVDIYATSDSVTGIVNDFGAGVPSRFTPINARVSQADSPVKDSDTLNIGVKQIYQGSWNPVAGLSDTYSRVIWDAISDPGTFRHPYKGNVIPVRSTWDITANGPDGAVKIPDDAIIWDQTRSKWVHPSQKETTTTTKANTDVAYKGAHDQDSLSATTKVTFDFAFGNWHHGQRMDMNDILYSVYFLLEWGSQRQENDKTFDSEYSPRAIQSVKNLKAIRIVDKNTIEVYQDFWHFDKGEIADRASVWSTTPWEVFAAMEQVVIDGKASFSQSEAAGKTIPWFSFILPKHANMIKQELESFKQDYFIPPALRQFENNGNNNQFQHNDYNDDVDDNIIPSVDNYYEKRFNASISWIEDMNHAVISNGPFFLDRYSPESRTIIIKAFKDSTYPIPLGKWNHLETVETAKIWKVNLSTVLDVKGNTVEIPVYLDNTSELIYFVSTSAGRPVVSDKIILEQEDNNTNGSNYNKQKQQFQKVIISISNKEKISQILQNSNDLQLFAVSNEALRPDIYETSFLAVQDTVGVDTASGSGGTANEDPNQDTAVFNTKNQNTQNQTTNNKSYSSMSKKNSDEAGESATAMLMISGVIAAMAIATFAAISRLKKRQRL